VEAKKEEKKKKTRGYVCEGGSDHQKTRGTRRKRVLFPRGTRSIKIEG
jgi:hypothetical protein